MNKKGLLFILLTLSCGAFAAPATSSDLNQCAVDLCGPPEGLSAVHLSGAFADTTSLATKKIQSEVIAPLLDRSNRNLREIRRLEAEVSKDLLAHGNQIDLSKEDASLLFLAVARSIVEPFRNQVVDVGSDGSEWISLKKLAPLVPAIDPALLKSLVDARNIYSADPEYMISKMAEKSGLDKFIQTIFSKNTFSPDIKRYFLEGRHEILTKKSGSFARVITAGLRKDLLLQDLSKQPYTIAEEIEVMKLVSISYALESLRSELVAAKLKSMRISTKELFDLIGLEKRVQRSDGDQAHFASDDALKNVGKFCDWKARKYMAAAPSDLRVRKTLELYERIKESSKRVLPQFFDGAALEASLSAIDRIRVETPPTLNRIEERMRALLAGQENLIAARHRLYRQIESGLTVTEKLFVLANDLGRAPEEVKIEDELQKVCSNIRIPNFEDRAYLSEKVLVIGWQTSIFPEVAVGVMAHETGHLVSFAVRGLADGKKGYDEKNQCSSVRTAAITGDKKPSTVFNEEDWADDFAIAVHEDMRRRGSLDGKTNFACALTDTDPETLKYRNLSFNYPKADVHSPSLLRALRVHIGSGHSIPESCGRAIGDAFLKIEPQSCQ